MKPELEKCVSKLVVRKVNTRYIYAALGDSYQSEEITEGLLNNKQQLKTLDKLGFAQVNDENFYVYKFYNTIGIRCITDEDKKLDDQEDIEPILEIQAQFSVEYFSHCELDEDALNDFGDGYVYFHLWPYWREIIQSSCCRMGIPPITVNAYRVPASDD
ncbi:MULTISPECIES: hypothetical protein [Pseudoalteromonas]|uniref:Uncharacterized protein n=1 Tax=Pseudoalteromonas maricaloris TaxID=184924 RepID=A0A8I2GZE6_9GAMM|nr:MULTISPECIES: hypothetical protein [Pseudoalteromonas]MCG9758778.1 hypothetical protein [Pseudoalteromonas sp. Isolate6]NLR20503.1 hypothetical protein [Pseudoalteromonas maricaloris]RZG15176.1 hypothetical protein EXT47_10530 [Pseudoalteromonas sp. CO342X]WOX30007.1 hypothetical protein R5H13_06990 [Pseudoalteromonas maricaloris]